MSRPRLEAEQKKVSFSLAFSPKLIAALDKVRGAKSQSVFVEEWLRQNPEIAAELVAMNDTGFNPPVVRYEQLMDNLLKFYRPELSKRASLASTLFIAQKAIMLESTGGANQTHEYIQDQIVAALEEFWLQERRKKKDRTTHGDSLEAILPDIKDYARYFYEVIFLNMAKGDRKLLQTHFRALVRGCEAVYEERLKREAETT
jgi:CRISPR type I-D-associated protein Csc3/Cas10d